jgi:MFS family permease
MVAQLALAIPAVLQGLWQQDLGTTTTQLTWISDAFLVPVTLLELTFGVLGDLFGRKRLLIFGGLAIVVGEIIGVLTPGMGSSTDERVAFLWIGQAIAGIGAAALMPTTLAMIAAGTHTGQERGRSIAIWAAALSAGNVVSPVLGGLVVRLTWGSDITANWRWAFVLVAVLALVSSIGSYLLADNSSAPVGRSLDWPGQFTIAVALFALLFAIIQAPTSGWGSIEVILGFIVAAVFLVLFILVERRSRAPLLRLDLFGNRAFAVTALATVIGMFGMLGTNYSTSVRLTAIQGFSPLKASIAFVLLNGIACAQVPLTMKILPKWNPRLMLGIGFGLIAIGDFWMATTTAHNFSLWPLVPGLILVGIGFAFAVSSVTAVAINSVPVNLAGMASGATGLLRDFGFTLGPALIGAIALSRAADTINNKIASSPTLAHAVSTFYASPTTAPTAALKASAGAAVGAVKSGPLGKIAVPATVPGTGGKVPLNPLHDTAFNAANSAFQLGYVVCGGAAAVACLLAVFFIGGATGRQSEIPLEETESGARVRQTPAAI